ncbi:hypothetical protein D037_1330A, partial [Vibrio parahaemolyticus IDH02640]
MLFQAHQACERNRPQLWRDAQLGTAPFGLTPAAIEQPSL